MRTWRRTERSRTRNAKCRTYDKIPPNTRHPAHPRSHHAPAHALRHSAIRWKFQTRTDGEDPLVEWKKLKSEGKIKKLKREEGPGGGIPIPMASFGVGGEFGVGGGEY